MVAERKSLHFPTTMTEFEDTWAHDVADTAYVARSQVPTSIYQTATTKHPMMYGGRSSWLAYEEAIDDWCDITELEPENEGPHCVTVYKARQQCTNHCWAENASGTPKTESIISREN